jgi:DNA-directed RNA polymerase specialized sigma24 family protein
MRGVLLNLVRDAARQARRKPVVVPLEDDLASDERSPAVALSERQARADYRSAWSQLSAKDRDCIRSRLEDRLPYDAIAKRLGMPSANAARVAFGRALMRLCLLMKRPDCESMRAPARVGGRARRRRTKSGPLQRQIAGVLG